MGALAMILQSVAYHFHRLDLTGQGGFIVTIYDEDGLIRPVPVTATEVTPKLCR